MIPQNIYKKIAFLIIPLAISLPVSCAASKKEEAPPTFEKKIVLNKKTFLQGGERYRLSRPGYRIDMYRCIDNRIILSPGKTNTAITGCDDFAIGFAYEDIKDKTDEEITEMDIRLRKEKADERGYAGFINLSYSGDAGKSGDIWLSMECFDCKDNGAYITVDDNLCYDVSLEPASNLAAKAKGCFSSTPDEKYEKRFINYNKFRLGAFDNAYTLPEKDTSNPPTTK
jgi:hypothetical protein